MILIPGKRDTKQGNTIKHYEQGQRLYQTLFFHGHLAGLNLVNT